MPGISRTNTAQARSAPYRTSGFLSDGTAINAVEEGGVIYVYSSTDFSTWTLRATVTPSVLISQPSYWSIAIAPNNDIGIVYHPGTTMSQATIFRRLTYAAGPTYTVGAEETVKAAVTATAIYSYDLGFASNSIPVVAISYANNATTSPTYYHSIYIKSNGTTWVECTGAQLVAGSKAGDFVSLACDSQGIVSNNILVCVFRQVYALTTGDNSKLQMFSINTTTGALTQTILTSSSPDSSASYFIPGVFSSGPGKFDIAVVQDLGTNSSKMRVCRVSGSPGGAANSGIFVVAWTASALFSADSFYTQYNNLYADSLYRHVGFMYAQDTLAITYIWTTGGYRNTYWRAMRITEAQNLGDYSTTTGATEIAPSLLGTWRDTGGSPRTTKPDDQVGMQFSMVNANLAGKAIGSRRVLGASYNADSKAWLVQENVSQVGVVYSPADGGTVATNFPTLQTRNYGGTTATWWQGPFKPEFQLAKDSGFTTSLKDIIGQDSLYAKLTALSYTIQSYTIGAANALSQGVWYMRVRLLDVFQNAPAFSGATATSFTDTHPPSASISSPLGDTYLDYGASGSVGFTWQYSDSSPDSTQTAYQIVIERNDTGAAVLDTGKVTSTVQSANVTIPAAQKDQPLRWKIAVWDQDNVQGPYSGYGLFRVGDKPTVTLTAPGTVNNPAPTFNWTFTAAGGRTQATYRVVVIRTADASVVHDSGIRVGTATSYTLPSPLLNNNDNYTVQVTVTDSVGLSNSTPVTAFPTSWTPPAAPSFTVSTIQYQVSGSVQITWTNAAKDATFSSWRVYRRLTGSTLATLVYETGVDQANYSFSDYMAGTNTQYDYVVVQVATRFGSLVESVYSWQTVTPVGDMYWLFGTDANTNPAAVKVALPIVTADSFTEEYEAAEMQIIGRGRRVDYGTRWGYKGTLSVQLRTDSTSTARAKRLQLEQLRAQKAALYLRNPFGDIWQVNVSDIALDRVAGTGSNEFCNATIPYAEVS